MSAARTASIRRSPDNAIPFLKSSKCQKNSTRLKHCFDSLPPTVPEWVALGFSPSFPESRHLSCRYPKNQTYHDVLRISVPAYQKMKCCAKLAHHDQRFTIFSSRDNCDRVCVCCAATPLRNPPCSRSSVTGTSVNRSLGDGLSFHVMPPWNATKAKVCPLF